MPNIRSENFLVYFSMADGINIEIGARTDPIIEDLDIKFTQGRKTLLVDKRFWGNQGAENFEYTQADSQALPFADDSADLLVSTNMFCADGFRTQDANWKISVEDVGNFESIATELFRIAKPGSSAIVIETATPYEGLLEKLDKAFSGSGFTRKPEDVLQNDQISKLFTNGSSGSKEKYQTPNAFAVIYHKQ